MIPQQRMVTVGAYKQEGAPSVQRIAFVYFDAGGGHRSAMESLLTVIQRQQRPLGNFYAQSAGNP